MERVRFYVRELLNFNWVMRSCLLVLFIAVCSILFFTRRGLERVIQDKQVLIEKDFLALSIADRIRLNVARESEAAQLFVLTGKPELLDRVTQQHEKIVQLFHDLHALLSDAKILAKGEALRKLYLDHWRRGQLGLTKRRRGNSLSEVHSFMEKTTRVSMEGLDRAMDDLRNDLAKHLDLANAASHAKTKQVAHGFTLLAGVTFATFAVITLLVLLTLKQQSRLDEERARRLQKAKQLANARKEVVEIVAHDLRSPLSTIKMSVDMILEQLDEAPKRERLATGLLIAQRAAASMEQLIVKLLDHAKIEADQLVLEVEPVDVAQMAKDLIERIKVQMDVKGIKLHTRVDHGPVIAPCDPGRIEQVLANLLSNALKFTPPGGAVTLHVSSKRDQILICVQDSGPGIASQDLNQVFERFWQSRTTAKRGLGLGLTICKAVVEAHHGRIWVESELGKGARFYISLPTVAPKDHQVPDPKRLGSREADAGSMV